MINKFDEFWSLYPRKACKLDAAKAWDKITDDPDKIIGALKNQLAAKAFDLRDNKRFVPLPATWLRGHRWEDEVLSSQQEPVVNKYKQSEPNKNAVNKRDAYKAYLVSKQALQSRFKSVVIDPLQETVNTMSWRAFIEPLLVVSCDDGILTLYSDVADWTVAHYMKQIELLLKGSNSTVRKVVITDEIPETFKEE